MRAHSHISIFDQSGTMGIHRGSLQSYSPEYLPRPMVSKANSQDCLLRLVVSKAILLEHLPRLVISKATHMIAH